jgi:hypothetical protein
MGVFEFIFGATPRPQTITAPPAGVTWRHVHARPGLPVTAHLAAKNGVLRSRRGRLRYRKGADYIVEREEGGRWVTGRDVFERTYEARADGHWQKRSDIRYRYFTLPHPVIVATPEGPQRADAGDWIMEGVKGELWPIPARRAERRYTAAEPELAAGQV